MIAVKVGPDLTSAVVAAPSYFERFPRPLHPRDLAAHRCIRRRFSNGTIYRWEFEKDREEITVSVNGPLILGEDRPIIKAAIGGAGLAYLFESRVGDYIAEGRLERVLEDWCAPYAGPYLYYPSRRQMRPALRAFIDFFRHSG
jgi:DNA-binding transcriptional LysR family regulator